MAATYEGFDERLREVELESNTNKGRLAGHERECAIRYGHINENVAGIRRDLRQAASVVATIMLAVLGFLIKLVFFSGGPP
jgi:hypothetical protein